MSHRSPALRRSACRRPGLGPSQARALHSSTLEFGDLHSGFRGNRICDPLRKKQASISCIRWTCPPKFILNGDWQVAAGGQSKERIVQEQREMGVTEVNYRHPSAIPSSPSISLDAEEGLRDDSHDTPVIPLTPIEDDEEDSSSMKDPLGTPAGLEADIDAAASAVLTALIKSNEQGSLIDTGLLIKILSDPKMIELLKYSRAIGNEKSTVQHQVKQDNQYMIQPRDPVKEDLIRLPTKEQLASEILAMLMSITAVSSALPPCSVSDTISLLKKVRENADMLLKQAQTPSDTLLKQPLPQKQETLVQNSIPVSKLPASSVPMLTRVPSAYQSALSGKTTQHIRDSNYFKNLVRQHGVERQELQGQKHNPIQFGNRLNLRESSNVTTYQQRLGYEKLKTFPPQPCIYFNSPTGCRLGLSCPFRHESLYPQQLRAQGFSNSPCFKRVKL